MSLEFTIKHEDLFPERPVDKPDKYTERSVARAVLKDSDGKIAVVSVKHEVRFWQLPGGGVDDGEDIEGALRRECKEEAGCDISIIKKLGEGREIRDEIAKMYISEIYLVEVVGGKEEPQGDESEHSIGVEVKWLTPKDALQIFIGLRELLKKGELLNEYNRSFFTESNINILNYLLDNNIV